MVALFVSRVSPGWEMHTQQGKGKRDPRQFSKNNTAQVSCMCPRAHPALTPRRDRRVNPGFWSQMAAQFPLGRRRVFVTLGRPDRCTRPVSPLCQPASF